MTRCGYCGSEEKVLGMSCEQCDNKVHNDCLEEIAKMERCPTYACRSVSFVDKKGEAYSIERRIQPEYGTRMLQGLGLMLTVALLGAASYAPEKSAQQARGREYDKPYRMLVVFCPEGGIDLMWETRIGPLRPDGTF